jgi:hydrogenase expression/formation protein HypD
MRYVDEYRDRSKAAALAARISGTCPPGARYKIMEICGGHTHTIYKHGLEAYLPEGVELVHGPGCPVCVIPMGRVNDAISLACTPGVTMTCFGDMLRVPSAKRSLLDAKAAGADVRVVYSPLDALHLAEQLPGRQVVFLAVGFETTAPSTAMTLLQAEARDVRNFSVFCNHVTVVPPLRAILDSDEVSIDGFIGPGHVSAVIGCRPYREITEGYAKPVVVSGFEPLDLLQAVHMLLLQLVEGRCEVENQYRRVVTEEGNRRAQQVVDETMELRPSFEWRGLGDVAWSGLRLRDRFAAFDAELRFEIPGVRVGDPRACQCGQVLRGMIQPWECRVFGTACTPEKPIGTCMVSSEGACAAYYNFGRGNRPRAQMAGRG